MGLSTEQLNSPNGKVKIPGVYSLVLGTDVTSSGSFTTSSSAWDGYLTLTQGTSSEQYWYGASNWNDLGEPISYIGFTPSIPLSSTNGMCCSVKASFATTGGSGEIALYAIHTGYSNPALATWIGSGIDNPDLYQTEGWINDGTSGGTLLDAHHPVAEELSTATELRLVFRNSVPTSAITISAWHIYEPITACPSGTGEMFLSYAYTNMLIYSIDATGASGYRDRAGLVRLGSLQLTGWTPTPEDNISPISNKLSNYIYYIYNMPSGLFVGDTLKIYDSYGNYGYLEGTQNSTTGLSGMLTGSYSGNTVSVSAWVLSAAVATGLNDLLVTQVIWKESYDKQSTVYTISTSSMTGDSINTVYTLENTFDITGNYDILVWLYAKRYEPCLEDYTYYLYNYGKQIYTDPIGPDIYAANAYSRPGHVLFSFATSDKGALSAHELRMNDGSYLVNYGIPHQTTVYVTSACTGIAGEMLTGSIIMHDVAGNKTTSEVLSAVVGEGTYGEQTLTPYNIPNLEILLCEDLDIVLRWDSWARFTSGLLGYRIPISSYKIYRKTQQESAYTLIDTLTTTAYTYLDNSLITVGVYDYVVVGIDDLLKEYCLSGTAYVLDNPYPDWIPFIEPYLAMFPVWTAAPAKKHTLEKLL